MRLAGPSGAVGAVSSKGVHHEIRFDKSEGRKGGRSIYSFINPRQNRKSPQSRRPVEKYRAELDFADDLPYPQKSSANRPKVVDRLRNTEPSSICRRFALPAKVVGKSSANRPKVVNSSRNTKPSSICRRFAQYRATWHEIEIF